MRDRGHGRRSTARSAFAVVVAGSVSLAAVAGACGRDERSTAGPGATDGSAGSATSVPSDSMPRGSILPADAPPATELDEFTRQHPSVTVAAGTRFGIDLFKSPAAGCTVTADGSQVLLVASGSAGTGHAATFLFDAVSPGVERLSFECHGYPAEADSSEVIAVQVT